MVNFDQDYVTTQNFKYCKCTIVRSSSITSSGCNHNIYDEVIFHALITTVEIYQLIALTAPADVAQEDSHT